MAESTVPPIRTPLGALEANAEGDLAIDLTAGKPGRGTAYARILKAHPLPWVVVVAGEEAERSRTASTHHRAIVTDREGRVVARIVAPEFGSIEAAQLFVAAVNELGAP